MVYATPPEGTEATEEVAEVRPLVQSSTDEWLARISDQLQVFVDKLEDLSDDEDDDGGAGGDPDTTSGSTPDTTPPPAPEKKTTAKRAEVKGD